MKFNIYTQVMGIFGKAQVGKSYFIKNFFKGIDYIVINGSMDFEDYKGTHFIVTNISNQGLDEAIIKIRAMYSNKLIIIDDVDAFNPLYSQQIGILARTGRHQGLGLVYASGRPALLPPVLLSGTDVFVNFMGVPAMDWENLAEKLGMKQNPFMTINAPYKYQIVNKSDYI